MLLFSVFHRLVGKENTDAALSVSVFHFREIKIPELKSYLCSRGCWCAGGSGCVSEKKTSVLTYDNENEYGL